MMVFQAPRGRSGRVGRHKIPKPKVHLPAEKRPRLSNRDIEIGRDVCGIYADAHAGRLFDTVFDIEAKDRAQK